MKIYDLTLTTKSNVTNRFYEEVFEFLYDREIRGLAQVSVSGESGLNILLIILFQKQNHNQKN